MSTTWLPWTGCSMGTVYRRSQHLYSTATTRYLTIPTSPATQVSLTSGFWAMQLFNVGSASLVYGDSNIAVNSGAYLYPASPKSWEELEDGWSIYVRADSAVTVVSVTEYRV